MTSATNERTLDLTTCRHCGQQLSAWKKKDFCCLGCETVYHLLKSSNLDNFYKLRPGSINPLVNYFQRKQSFEWLETLPEIKDGHVRLKIEGIQCAACIWAIREIGKRLGTVDLSIDPTTGEMSINFDSSTYPLKTFLERIQELGYRTGPASTEDNQEEIKNNSLQLRLGICGAIAMVTMCMSFGLYFGLDSSDPLLYQLSLRLNYYLAIICVAVGGSYFFHRAYLGLKNRVLHFDLPIAIGILAAFTGSVYSHYRGEISYFDSVTGFITLMLAGRYAQERFIYRNRQQLLQDDPLSHLTATRLKNGGIEEVSFKDILENDRLVICAGAILPVSAKFESTDVKVSGEFSLAWINGESAPIVFRAGQTIPAGASYIGLKSLTVTAAHPYQKSALNHLTPEQREHDLLPLVWQQATKFYVLGVLAAAIIGFTTWLWIDPVRAPMIATAILVITCPCSLGLAIPLARVMANRRMVSWGVFARDGALLDKWLSLKKVFFDKTGTLTFAQLQLLNNQDLNSLDVQNQTVLYNISGRSRHPASQSLYQFLTPQKLSWISDFDVEEKVGQGLTASHNGHHYFLGRSPDQQNESYEVIFNCDGETLARFHLAEEILDGAKQAIQQLQRQGLELFQLSGDKQSRVNQMAQTLGLDSKQSLGNLTPSEKAFQIRQMSRLDSLYLGDGLNDSQAFSESHLCGAPVWEKSIMAQHADFYFLSTSLLWLPRVFALSQQLKSTINFNLLFAVLYNICAVILAMAGLISPLAAAIMMPTSSLLVLFLTAILMRKVKTA